MYFLLLRALIFATVFNLSSIVGYIELGEFSNIGSGADDPIYLIKPFAVANGYLEPWFYFEHSNSQQVTTTQVITSAPNAAFDYVIGKCAIALHIAPFELGLILDLIFAFLCYLASATLFRKFTASNFIAEVACLVSLLVPYVFFERIHWPIISTYFPAFFSGPYLDYDLPFQRSIYTQASYAVYLIILTMITRYLQSINPLRNAIFIIGLLSASLLYIYQFAWITIVPLTCLLLLFRVIHCKQSIKIYIRDLLYFGFIFLLISLPAILITLGKTHITGKASEIGSFWYFSPEAFVTFIVCGWVSLQKRYGLNARLSLWILSIFSFLEIGLMNLQPILGEFIGPYHFPRFYLHPIMSGLIIILLFQLIAFRYGAKFSKCWIAILAGSLLIAFAPLDRVLRLKIQAEDRLYAEVLSFVKNNLEKTSVVAVMSDDKPFRSSAGPTFSFTKMPNMLNAMSDKFILFSDWSTSGFNNAESISREMALGFYFSSQAQLLWPCPLSAELPGDIFVFTWTYYKLKRFMQCKLFPQVVNTFNACDAVKSFKVDYIVWDKEFRFAKPALINELSKSVWSGSTGRFEILTFDRQKALEKLCH